MNPNPNTSVECPKCHSCSIDEKNVCRSYQCCPHEKIRWTGMSAMTCPDCGGTVTNPGPYGVAPCTCTVKLVTPDGDMYGSDSPCPVHETNTVTPPQREQLELLRETEKLIEEITTLTQTISGLKHSGRTREQAMERYRELYDERRTKITRVEEIARLSLEKGYITD